MDTELAQTRKRQVVHLYVTPVVWKQMETASGYRKKFFYQTSAIDAVTKQVFEIHIPTQGIPPSVLLNALPHFMLFRHWLFVILCIAAHICMTTLIIHPLIFSASTLFKNREWCLWYCQAWKYFILFDLQQKWKGKKAVNVSVWLIVNLYHAYFLVVFKILANTWRIMERPQNYIPISHKYAFERLLTGAVSHL